MRKVWAKPKLEVLDIRMTMNGPGKAIPDCFDTEDPMATRGETGTPNLSNASCKDPNLGS